ncbi:MAG TPA: hypothetical protein VNY36_09520, partial [Bacteroidia bacterium]|nr:hypothetical protein [Bacteroidia bacterium]
MSMASGTTLILGLTTSSTLSLFPTSFTAAHISLDAASNVLYQAHNTSSGQTVSAVPTYGNLTVTTSNAGTTNGSTFTVNGNVVIGQNVVFKVGDVTATLKGNLTISSGGEYYGGEINLYLGGNLTNNGTYVDFSGEVITFNGTSNQVISGTGIAASNYFNSWAANTASASDTVFIERNIMLNAGLRNYTTVVVPASSNDSIIFDNFAGGLSDNTGATFLALNGVVYFSAVPSKIQGIAGNSITLYKLTTASDFEPTSSNYTVTSDCKIVSGSFGFGNNNMNLGGNFTNNGDSVILGGVTMIGSHNQTIGGTTASVFKFLTINTSTSTDTVKLSNRISISNVFTNSYLKITQGTFDVSPNNYSLIDGGAFTNNANSSSFVSRNGIVTMNSTVAQTIGGTSSTKFNNLTITPSSGTPTFTLGNNETINSNLLISGGTLDVNSTHNYGLTIGGNFTNNATFNAHSDTVFFNGIGNQNVGGSTATTFYNLTTNQAATTDTVFMTNAITVSKNLTLSKGVFDCQNYQLTGNTSGILSMASGTGLVLGLTSSSTNVTFPTLYTAAHTSLNSNSTVVYQANTASQNILVTPTYGNLTVSSGTSVTKTPSGTPLAIAGNLCVSNPVTLSETTNTINLTGNLTNTGTLSFSSGALNIGGNFNNGTTGTFTSGTGTVTFNGGNDKTVNNTSSSALAFNNFTENLTLSTDTLFLTIPVTVSNTLTQTQGILNCEKNQLTNSATPPITTSPVPDSICSGYSATLTASSYTNYAWYPSTGLITTTGTSVTAFPLTTTTYTVVGSTSSKDQCALGTNAAIVKTNCIGSSCAKTYNLNTDTCFGGISLGDSNTWFSFTALTNFANFVIHSPNDTILNRITHVVIYTGTCSSLSPLDTLYNNMPFEGDSLIYLNLTPIDSGHVYYLKAIASQTNYSPGRSFSICGGLHKKTFCSPGAPACDLVSNGNFETCSSGFPTAPGQLPLANCWQDANGYKFLSADYYNSLGGTSNGVPLNCGNLNCSGGYQCSSNGTPDHTAGCTGSCGYAGISTAYFAQDQIIIGGVKDPYYGYYFLQDYAEYLQQHMNSAMQKGYTYNVSFWTFLSPESAYKIDAADIGVYISNYGPGAYLGPPNGIYCVRKYVDLYGQYPGPVLDPTGNIITPTITGAAFASTFNTPCTWVNINGNYTSPLGGEDWITLGRFKSWCKTGTAPTQITSLTCSTIGLQAYYYIDDISIKEVGMPPISINTPSSICPGNSATLTVSGATGTGLKYTWSTGATTSSITVSPSTTTTYSLSVTDLCVTVTATSTVTVDPLPSLPSSVTVCSGNLPVTLNYCSPCTVFNSYSWSGTGLSCTNCIDPVVSPTVTTTYTVTVTALGGCTTTGDVVVTVIATPTLSVSGPDLVCNPTAGGSSFTYTVTGNASSYSWAGIGCTPSSTTGTSYTVTSWTSTADGGDVICTATGSDGCTAIDTFLVRGA